jgi:TrkA domain protein
MLGRTAGRGQETIVEIRIREERLPGIGMRYDVDLATGQRLFVVAEMGGRRHIGGGRAGDAPEWEVMLDQEHAVILAALLLGARFTLDTREDPRVASNEVVVDTVELGGSSPALGKTKAEIRLAEDAAVLAIISDATPALIEDEAVHRCQPGDRVVVAARADRIDEVAHDLAGPPP